MGEPGILQLTGIAGADGGNAVRRLNTALHQVDTAVMLHQIPGGIRQAKHIPQDLHAVFALILDIVDGIDRFDALITGAIGVKQAVIHRNQRRLPIVGVDHIRLKADQLDHLQHRAGKEGESLRVVIMAVEAGTLKIILVVQQIVDDAVVLGLKHTAILAAPGDRHRQAAEERHFVPQLLRH